MMARSSIRAVLLTLSAAGALLFARPAEAQQSTFHLDRLEVPGAPDDGVILFRPQTKEFSLFYAQIGLGYQLDPLHTWDITNDKTALRNSSVVVRHQLSTYMSAGFQFFDRLTLGATFPMAVWQNGVTPTYSTGGFGGSNGVTTFTTDGVFIPADIRLDGRYVAWRNEDRSQALGLQLSAWAPTGNGSSTNFGGDQAVAFMPMVTGEWTPKHFVTLIANLGVHFRHDNSINDPTGKYGAVADAGGLGVGNEWRWAVGAMLPVAEGRHRFGVTFFGQTGLQSNDTTGNTFFTSQNTPIEWHLDWRMKLPIGDGQRWFFGAGGGSGIILRGYGAPDLRVLTTFGTYFPIEDTNPNSPEAKIRVRASIHESMKDTDGDGIPDDIDACPDVPEDKAEPDPNDGCPKPADRDGDGIPDMYDKCPDQPEDKDGIDDSDGCPEDDVDGDGIPDAKDACPREPGQPDPDPKKNGCPKFIRLEGSSVRVLQQVHFATASATILPDSFPMLQEIVNLLKATPGIKKMRVEGHTDNHGDAAMNLDLSKRRAASVRKWLTDHGIDSVRLDSEGYGLTRPIQSNDTAEGRAANRRVEFKIIDEASSKPPPAKEQAPEKPEPPPPSAD